MKIEDPNEIAIVVHYANVGDSALRSSQYILKSMSTYIDKDGTTLIVVFYINEAQCIEQNYLKVSDGKYIIHRLDGPAVTSSAESVSVWYKNGFRHREDGPAREYYGMPFKSPEYFLENVPYTREEFFKQRERMKSIENDSELGPLLTV